MATNNSKIVPQKMLIICLLISIGFSVLGLGIGISTNRIWSSTLIGAGLGFITNAGLILKIYYSKMKSTNSE